MWQSPRGILTVLRHMQDTSAIEVAALLMAANAYRGICSDGLKAGEPDLKWFRISTDSYSALRSTLSPAPGTLQRRSDESL